MCGCVRWSSLHCVAPCDSEPAAAERTSPNSIHLFRGACAAVRLQWTPTTMTVAATAVATKRAISLFAPVYIIFHRSGMRLLGQSRSSCGGRLPVVRIAKNRTRQNETRRSRVKKTRQSVPMGWIDLTHTIAERTRRRFFCRF